jgi:drug/metabolite transporter (DMT)-like permease
MLPAFLTTLMFSISAVTARRAIDRIGSTAANAARLSLAALLLAAWAHSFGRGLQGGALTIFVLSGCIGFGVGDAGLYAALPRIGSRLSVMLVQCLAVPIAAMIEWVWLGTTLTFLQVACAAVVIAGVAVALAPNEKKRRTASTRLSGIMFGILGAAGQAVGAVLSRKGYAVLHAGGETLDGGTAAYQRIIGGVAVAALVFICTRTSRVPVEDPAIEAGELVSATGTRAAPLVGAWRYVLMTALAGPVLGVSCFQWALRSMPSGLVLPIVATTPLVIIPFSRYFEGERIALRAVAGGLLAVLGAVALAIRG